MSDWNRESECLDWAAEATVGDDGIVRGVALCGKVSKNGYSFSESAFGDVSRAKSLYENRPAFVDHPDTNGWPYSRSARDLAGTVENVVLRNGRPYGDVRTLETSSGALFRSLAKQRPANVGMSHVARYRFTKDKTRVEAVEEVASVDLVVFPATTKSFSESQKGLEMSDSNEKLTAHFEKENTRLQAELDRSVKQVQERDVSVAAITKERDELRARVASLESENKTLKADADKFAAEKAIAGRRSLVESKLKEHGLNSADKAIVSDVFVESLLAEPDDAKRETLIKDRKAAFESAVKGSAGFHSPERQGGGNGFNPADTLKSWGV